MPQYQLNIGNAPGRHIFANLDKFAQGYLTCAFWTGSDEDGIDERPIEQLHPSALKAIEDDCRKFQNDNAVCLKVAYQGGQQTRHGRAPYDAHCAGIDFWLTRNGHGSGFWDRLLILDCGEELSRASRAFGARDLYIGDDKLIHMM